MRFPYQKIIETALLNTMVDHRVPLTNGRKREEHLKFHNYYDYLTKPFLKTELLQI